MDFRLDFASAQEALSDVLINTTRSASRLSVQDLYFHRSLDRTVGEVIDRQSARLLTFIQDLMMRCEPPPVPADVRLTDADSIDVHWRILMDIIDGLLERADTSLDEFRGLFEQSTPREGTSLAPVKQYTGSDQSLQKWNIQKPQLLFDVKPENNFNNPFKPFLTSKPHASASLDNSLTLRPNEDGMLQYQHPYATEIWEYEYPSFVYTWSEPHPCRPFDTTTATLVDDFAAVKVMLEELKKSTIIAVDLEHHDLHSYIGIVSLMQISTRDRDWIIDTLKPWRRKLEILNQVFADPTILKVLHGAHMDILWLQRDLGLYVVGLFDTFHASRVLGYPGGSLAYLLKRFVGFDAQKQYQTADWRIRPLPQEMFNYARSDTHFLLYIFDHMRNELIEMSNFEDYRHNRIQAVLARSKETSVQRYEHPIYDKSCGQGPGGWYLQLQRYPVLFSREQFAVFRRIHHWRDTVAREEDESPHQILSRNALTTVSQALPRDIPSLLTVCHPTSSYVRLRAPDLLETIRRGIVDSVDALEMHDVLSEISSKLGLSKSQKTALPEGNVPKNSTKFEVPTLNSKNADRLVQSHLWGTTLDIDLPHFPTSTSLPTMFMVTPTHSWHVHGSFSSMSADRTPRISIVSTGDDHASSTPDKYESDTPNKRGIVGAQFSYNSVSHKYGGSEPNPRKDASLRIYRKARRKATTSGHRAVDAVAKSPTFKVSSKSSDYSAASSVLYQTCEGRC